MTCAVPCMQNPFGIHIHIPCTIHIPYYTVHRFARIAVMLPHQRS